MLPNWLYGKSKSKLASILGGGSAPEDYEQVKAQVAQNKLDIEQNTEDIELLSDGLDDKAALTQITNPNLFDNPWFTINQRGLSNYVQAGYGVDRWRINADNTPTIEFTNNGIEISNYVTGNIVLYQRYESNFINNSKDYTLSIMASDGTILSSALKKDGSLFHMGELAGAQFYHKVTEVGNTFEIEIFVNTMTSNLVIRAAKLELGSVSTLGMDTAPNYATELLKCQRYFMRIGTNGEYVGIGIGQARSVTNCSIHVSLPVQMRAKPTLTVTGDILLRNGDTTITSTSGSVDSYPFNEVMLALTATGLSAGTVYDAFTGNNNAYLDLSADL